MSRKQLKSIISKFTAFPESKVASSPGMDDSDLDKDFVILSQNPEFELQKYTKTS